MTADVPSSRRGPWQGAAVLLLCPLLLLPQPQGEARADTGPDGMGPGTSAGANAALHRAFADAKRATATYQRARKKTEAQLDATRRQQRAEAEHRRWRERLQERLGAVARAQYRAGPLAGGAALATARDPRAFLDRLSVRERGERAAARMLRAHRDAGERLRADRAAAERRLRAVRAAERRQERLKSMVRDRLWDVLGRLRQQGEHGGGCPVVPAPPRVPASSSPGEWTLPTEDYTLSAGYGGMGSRWAHGHSGQDFAVDDGTPVYAVGSGTVERTECSDGFGNQIVLRHGDGSYTQYAHLSLILAADGQRVRSGQLIGLAGSTGNSSGPHLHFEARSTPEMSSATEPLAWLRERGVRP